MKTFKSRLVVLLSAALLSMSAMAVNVSETQVLANQGDVTAQFNLALEYDIKQDYAKAVEWYTKAANQGHATAQYYLGMLYYHGEGVRQDYSKAFEWCAKAANQGHAGAQASLASMYKYGEGVRQDYDTAKEWYGKACDNGQQRGCEQYKLLDTKGF